MVVDQKAPWWCANPPDPSSILTNVFSLSKEGCTTTFHPKPHCYYNFFPQNQSANQAGSLLSQSHLLLAVHSELLEFAGVHWWTCCNSQLVNLISDFRETVYLFSSLRPSLPCWITSLATYKRWETTCCQRSCGGEHTHTQIYTHIYTYTQEPKDYLTSNLRY